MMVKLPLLLQGLDLRDVEAYDRVDHPRLAELSFEAEGGISLAVIYADNHVQAVTEAVAGARLIADLAPGVSVVSVHDELVSVSDIAARCGVAAEAVRLWALGKRRAGVRPFPAPRQVIRAGAGAKSMSLYTWREVLSWVREVIGIDPDDGITYLDDADIAALNAILARLRTTAAPWHPLPATGARVTAPAGHTSHRSLPNAGHLTAAHRPTTPAVA